MKSHLLKLALLTCLSLLTGVANAEGNWITDQNGCKHWNSNPQAGETITWSGECKDGYASGEGTRQWYMNEKPVSENYVGSMSGGKYNGNGKSTLSDGSIVQGMFTDGQLNGHGKIYTSKDGLSMEGEFINNEPSGEVTVTFESPQGDIGLIKFIGDYAIFKNKTNGYITRTLKDGTVETMYQAEGKNYKDKETYEASKKTFGNRSTTSGSCVDECDRILNREKTNCSDIFTKGSKESTECLKEAMDDYNTCKVDCRHARSLHGGF